ncbi:hypothetical protein Gotur_015089 [Gossypium turneri]
MDGASFFHVFSSCLEIVNGSSSLSKPLVFQRCFLNNNTIDDFHTIRIPNSYIKQIANEADDAPSGVKVRVFHFIKEVIAKLKEKSNVEVGINDEISSLQALLCHLWRSIVCNKKIDPDQETSYCLLIDARKRIRGLSEAYFGNALQIETVTMKVKEMLISSLSGQQGFNLTGFSNKFLNRVSSCGPNDSHLNNRPPLDAFDVMVTGFELRPVTLDNGLGNAAWQMNKVVASCHEEKLRNFFECWKRCPKLTRLSNLAPNIAVVTSGSPRFDIYGGNTGLGRPVAIRSGPGNKFDGRATVQSGNEDGSIDIEVCLPVETFEAMEKDKEFMDTVIASNLN